MASPESRAQPPAISSLNQHHSLLSQQKVGVLASVDPFLHHMTHRSCRGGWLGAFWDPLDLDQMPTLRPVLDDLRTGAVFQQLGP